jgi:formylglycine-generating enzyme required for sulfatase activity
MTLVRIPAGRFTMGSPPSEAGRETQEVQHAVTLTRPFYLGRFEVTQAQWQTLMGANPSHFAGRGSDLPVERVSFHEIADFLSRLTARDGAPRFRLPTEAEWEYACRAGSTTAYAFGDELSAADANVDARGETGSEKSFRGAPMPVGSFRPNAWGLYDMHGNVWEWTDDRHCPYSAGPSGDPRGTCESPLQVIRGGSWYFAGDSARCALRYTHRPQDRGFSLGFRVARDALAP